METVTMTRAKKHLRALIDRASHGETVLILDRGVPVARLEAVSGAPEAIGRLSRLKRAGVIRAGSGLAGDLLRVAPVRPLNGASAVEALLDERRSDR